MQKEVSMTIRLEPDLRASFTAATEQEHRPAAQVLRELMRSYVEQVRKKAVISPVRKVDRIAPPHTYEQVVQAEIANEILNTAHSIIYARMDEIEATDPVEAARLFEISKGLHKLQRSFGVTDAAAIANIIATWGERIKDREAFIKSL